MTDPYESDRGHAIAAKVAQRHGLSLREILAGGRDRRTAWPRQDAMRAIREETTLSLPQIGRIFGRHHTTVMHGIQASERRAKG